MPIDYNTSFTKPMLKILEAKGVTGPEDMAKIFTDSYVLAVLQGLPGGLPSSIPISLPAPGINPTTPPPYFIASTAVPINNFEARKRRMQKVMYYYFLARQLIVQNGSIKSIIDNIKRVTKLIPQLKKDIKNTQDRIKLLVEEARKLPRLIEDLKLLVEVLVKEEVELLQRLYDGLSAFKIQLNLQETGVFKLVESFKNQEFTFDALLNRVSDITTVTRQLEDLLVNLPANEPVRVNTPRYDGGSSTNIIPPPQQSATTQIPYKDDTSLSDPFYIPTPNESRASNRLDTDYSIPEDPYNTEYKNIRRYILRKTLESFKNIFSVINCVASPIEYIGYFADLANYSQKYRRVLEVLENYKLIYVFIRPQALKLKRKLDEKVRDLKEKIKQKISEQKDRLKKKLDEKARNKYSQDQIEVRKSRVRQIRLFKKKTINRVRLIRFISTDIRTILTRSRALYKRVQSIEEAISYIVNEEMPLFVTRLQELDTTTSIEVAASSNGVFVNLPTFSPERVRDDMQYSPYTVGGQQYAPNIGQIITANPGLNAQLYINQAAAYTQGVANDYSALTSTNPAKIEETIARILNDMGLVKSRTIQDLLLKNLKLFKFKSPYPIYRFLLQESVKYTGLYNEITQLRRDFKELRARIKVLKKNVLPLVESQDYVRIDDPKNRKLRRDLFEIKKDPISFKLLINEFYGYISDEITAMKKDMKEFVEPYIQQAKNLIAKEAEKLQNLALSLVPVNSEVKESLNKQELIKYKKAIVKQKVRQVKRTAKKISTLTKAFNALRQFIIQNIIIKKQYRYSENEKPINDMIDAFFDYKILSLSEPTGKDSDTTVRTNRPISEDYGVVSYRKKPNYEIQKDLLNKQREYMKADIRALLTYLELFVDTFIEINDSIKSLNDSGQDPFLLLSERIEQAFDRNNPSSEYKNLAKAATDRIKFLFSKEAPGNAEKKIALVYETIKYFENISKVTVNDPQLNVNPSTTSLFLLSPIKTAIISFENEILGSLKNKYNAFANSELAQITRSQQSNNQTNPQVTYESNKYLSNRSAYYARLEKFVPKKPFEDSILLSMIAGCAWIFRELGKWLKGFYSKHLAIVFREVKDWADRQVQKFKDVLIQYQKRVTAYDTAYALPKALNIATKLFWQGFRWYAPDGTSFTCTAIPSIRPLRDLKTGKLIVGDDGISGWVDAASWALFKYQLPFINITVQPPPFTGIAPIPIIGYK